MKKDFWKKMSSSGGSKKTILALAPMAGMTDSAFREICRKYGADIVYTEMVSADGLFYDSKKTLELLKFNKKEKPIVVQLFGKRPETFTKAAQICEKYGFDGIDINFGCPAKKVVAHGGGITLMRDLDKCREIIQAVLAGTSLPVSVKIRAGIDNVKATDFIKKIKDLPVSAVMIHGRYFKNPFSGEIDYQMIEKIKNNFSGVVLGNGGINSPEDAKEMIDKTGVDGVGLARGLYGQPWLFQQTKEYLKKGKYKIFDVVDIKKAILEHAKLSFKSKDDHGLIEMRKHLLWYTKGFSGSKDLRKELVKVKSITDIKNILNKKNNPTLVL